MQKVTTMEQARALPMAPDEDELYLDEKGNTVRRRVTPKFYPRCADPDQILFFGEEDGRLMQIVYTEHGPAKREFHGIF